MAKLYPPYIEGSLPAFCLNEEGTGVMPVPFAYNKAVSKLEVKSIIGKFKTIQNDVLLGSVPGVIVTDSQGNSFADFYVHEFKIGDIDELKLEIGQYYKVQLAFVDINNIEGYFSTVGVIKFTSLPEVTIDNLDLNFINNNQNEFIGKFEQKSGGDVTEKVYSSAFVILDSQDNIFYSTDEILHNTENNPNSYISYDTMTFNRDLEVGEIYKIIYIVKTTNGLWLNSKPYLLTQQKSLWMEFQGDLIADLNYEEGYIDVRTIGKIDDNGSEENINGMFLLSREDSLYPGVWEEMIRFTFNRENPTKTIFRDFTVEQGKTYTYSLQQYNKNSIYSNRKKSNKIYADFEDMFLFDGKRQLKLRFNPQVSSFKTQLAESRSETIGSKYPFFFRNARIGYKVFPISAMISMLMDDNQFFVNYEDILRERMILDRHDTEAAYKKVNKLAETNNFRNLLSENMASERLFKLEVLDWLNDGHVKLFRSPGEGNYLVRLMDTSLSPQNTLGRMLHSVNTTAYECAENIYSNKVKYGIVDIGETDVNSNATIPSLREVSISGTQEISNGVKREYGYQFNGEKSDNLINAPTTLLRFKDCLPGTKFEIVQETTGSHIITIGATGDYSADNVDPITAIYLINTTGNENGFLNASLGTILYQFDNTENYGSVFDSVENVQTDIGAYSQFVGEDKNILVDKYPKKEQATKSSMIMLKKRPVEYLYYVSGEIPDIESGENVFKEDRMDNGYRKLTDKYQYKLFWEVPSGGLSNFEERIEELKTLFKKTPNPNGLPEDYWEVYDWARYYAMVAKIRKGEDIYKVKDMTFEELEDDFPKEYLSNYMSTKDPSDYFLGEQIQEFLPEYRQVMDEASPAFVIWADDGNKTWGAHLFDNCSHTYKHVMDKSRFGHGVPVNDTTNIYVYKPLLPDEVGVEITETNEIVVDLSQYVGRELGAEYFDDQENMEYSPFSLYILKNEWLDINGVKENIISHLPTSESIEEKTHSAEHLFERYYIDRYLKAQTPEEMLIERAALAERVAATEDEEIINEAVPLYVLDPWYGKIYEIGKDFAYNPYIIYNDENIDLTEIEKYELEDVDPSDETLVIGNGVYGENFYQKVIMTYGFENSSEWTAIDQNLPSQTDNNVTTAGYEAEVRNAVKEKEQYYTNLEEKIDEMSKKE